MVSPMLYIVCIAVVVTQLTIAQESTNNYSKLLLHLFVFFHYFQCNYIGLVKCFINILDEWAWTLYELKDNVVTITSDQCAHLKELDKCIKDDLEEQHQCSHREVIEVSNTVSDLLTHRKDSGSFLKSYYLLTYACSAEGQEILTKHRDCLKSEKIGEMTLSAGTYLSEKFLDHDDDEEACINLNLKLQEYIRAMSNLCSKHEAAQLMCKSLTNMFKVESSDVQPVQSEPDALGPVDGAAVLSVFASLLAILIR
uniref:Secreted protein n=1 Tax=Angiostrongylus cantonensis TaxID=6313 RepID=A0A0K0D331_ANGCA